MDTLKQLEYKYCKDYRGYFEDLASLLFCMEYHQSHGVNRRKNQAGIEADPIDVDGERIAFQAKYYDESTSLNSRKDDLKKSVEEAARENVTKLIIYTNKELTQSSTKEKPAFEQEIDDLARDNNMIVEWQTGSSINTTLEMPEYEYIRKIYFGSENNKDGFVAFYQYAVKKVTAHEKDCIYGDIPLIEGYLEPYIKVDNKIHSFKSYLYNWVSDQGNKDKIIIVFGEPGHGKTSLCYKAMYDHYKEGWLSGLVKNVFHISLNPSSTDALRGGKLDIKDLLFWGEIRQNKLEVEDFNDALVFFDGFDELIDSKPELRIADFINTLVSGFVDDTNAKVVITSRRMGIERELEIEREWIQGTLSERYYIKNAHHYSVFEIQPLTKEQQTGWISDYINYCEKQSKQGTAEVIYWINKSKNLIEYKKRFQGFQSIQSLDSSVNLLSIPLILRMIVESRYYTNDLSNSAKLYEELFDLTWDRHPKELPIRNTKEKTIKDLSLHAFKCFQDGSDSAITDVDLDIFWTYQFYTKAIKTSDDTTISPFQEQTLLRVGFLHRTFYQFYLAKYVIHILIGPKSRDENSLKEFLACLSRDQLNLTTLQYIKELYNLLKEKEAKYCEKTIEIVSDIINKTDAVLPEIYNMDWVKDGFNQRIVSPLEACNNLFWNIASIYTSTGHTDASSFCTSFALRRYSLKQANLESWNLKGYELNGADFEGANLKDANLKEANLQNALLERSILNTARLEEAHFEWANLIDANLIAAHLEEAHFEEANLRGADFDLSHLEDAHLENAFLEGAHLNGAHLERAFLKSAHLEGAYLVEAHLEGAHLEEAHLEGADFEGAHLEGAYLEGAHLEGTNFDGAFFEDGTS